MSWSTDVHRSEAQSALNNYFFLMTLQEMRKLSPPTVLGLT